MPKKQANKQTYMSITKKQNRHNMSKVCINIYSLDWYDTNSVKENTECFFMNSAQEDDKQFSLFQESGH